MSRPGCRLVSTCELAGLFTEAAGWSATCRERLANALQCLEAGQSGHAGAGPQKPGRE